LFPDRILKRSVKIAVRFNFESNDVDRRRRRQQRLTKVIRATGPHSQVTAPAVTLPFALDFEGEKASVA